MGILMVARAKVKGYLVTKLNILKIRVGNNMFLSFRPGNKNILLAYEGQT
jgi:hypothetical protein